MRTSLAVDFSIVLSACEIHCPREETVEVSGDEADVHPAFCCVGAELGFGSDVGDNEAHRSGVLGCRLLRPRYVVDILAPQSPRHHPNRGRRILGP